MNNELVYYRYDLDFTIIWSDDPDQEGKFDKHKWSGAITRQERDEDRVRGALVEKNWRSKLPRIGLNLD